MLAAFLIAKRASLNSLISLTRNRNWYVEWSSRLRMPSRATERESCWWIFRRTGRFARLKFWKQETNCSANSPLESREKNLASIFTANDLKLRRYRYRLSCIRIRFWLRRIRTKPMRTLRSSVSILRPHWSFANHAIYVDGESFRNRWRIQYSFRSR